jgi:uncharacterized protein
LHFSNYIKIFPCDEKPGSSLFFSARTGAMALLNDDTRRAAEKNALDENERETLSRLGLLVEDAADEERSMYGYLDALNAGSRHFNALVVLTLDCNLACRYCYEGTMKGRHYMSRETADLMVGHIERSLRPGMEGLNIDFYGGEPLLHTKLIEYISSRLGETAGKRGMGFTFTLTTNGTLLNLRTVRKLAGLGLIGVRITIDGPKENHDAYRPYWVSGRGSFDVIVHNIAAVCGEVKVSLGGNYDPSNYRTFPRLLDRLQDKRLSPGDIYSIRFDPISKTFEEFATPDFNDGFVSIDEPWIHEAAIFLREEILKRGYNTPRVVPSPCAVEVKDDIVVNYNGDIYKCPGLIGKTEFRVGDLRSGAGQYEDAYNVGHWKNDECIRCAYLPLCFGGCRFMKLLSDGTVDGVQCRREYFDSVLGAFLNQDLKYRSGAAKR